MLGGGSLWGGRGVGSSLLLGAYGVRGGIARRGGLLWLCLRFELLVLRLMMRSMLMLKWGRVVRVGRRREGGNPGMTSRPRGRRRR